MHKLDHYSEKDLQEELAKRAEKRALLPVPIHQHTNFAGLRRLVIKTIHDMAKDDYCDDNDDKQWIYEAAVEAVFGGDVWSWVREQQG